MHIFTKSIQKCQHFAFSLYQKESSWGLFLLFPEFIQLSSRLWFFRRLFGGKQSKQAPVTTAENMKNSTVISNPHATLNHVATVLESPDGGLVGGDSETNSPLFGGRVHGSGMGTLGSEPVRKKHMKNKRLYYLF